MIHRFVGRLSVMSSVVSLLPLTLLSSSTITTYAAPQTWYLNNVVFDDGTTAAGSLDYDADANEYSNIDITTDNANYGDHLPSVPEQQWARFFATVPDFNGDDDTVLRFEFLSDLTSRGGIVEINTDRSVEATCLPSSSDCSGYTVDRRVVSGNVTTPLTPTMSPWPTMPPTTSPTVSPTPPPTPLPTVPPTPPPTPLPTTATTLTWYLRDVEFEDGTTATGSFNYDAEANVYSNIAITTAKADYADYYQPLPFPFVLEAYPVFKDDLTNDPVLVLRFSTDLTSSGGDVMLVTGILTSFESQCDNSDCTLLRESEIQYIQAGGYVTTEAMPPPQDPPTMQPTSPPMIEPTSPPTIQPTSPPTMQPTSPSPPTMQPMNMPLPTTATPAPPTTMLTWYLRDVEFEDGTMATGSFDYDAEANVYSNIAITTAKADYADYYQPLPFPFMLEAYPVFKDDLTNEPLLWLQFSSDLTSSGGVVMLITGEDIFGSLEAQCTNPLCLQLQGIQNINAGGYVTTEAVPAPQAPPTIQPTMQAPSTNMLTWYLIDVQFNDGTTATGSFDYDAVNKVYSNIAITTSIASYGDYFDPSGGLLSPESGFFTVPVLTDDLTNEPRLRLAFEEDLDSPVVSSSGIAVINPGSSSDENTCVVSTCGISEELRYVTSGYVTTTPPPPTMQPTLAPQAPPTSVLTMQPTPAPQTPPTPVPTMQPTLAPQAPLTPVPTVQPTSPPTTQPMSPPTMQPTSPPTMQPTSPPMIQPTSPPTIQPTSPPTMQPTPPPTMQPTIQPTSPPMNTPLPTMMLTPSTTTLTWYLRDVEFEDGTTASGSFDYDAVNQVYSNIAITTGNAFYADYYPYVEGDLTIPFNLEALTIFKDDLTNEPVLWLQFLSELTSSGGTVMLLTQGASLEAQCASFDCLQRIEVRYVKDGGYVTTDPQATPTMQPTSPPMIQPTSPPTMQPTFQPMIQPTSPPTTNMPAPLTTVLTWYLIDVEFSDGTTATGSFDYNAETNEYSNIDLITAKNKYVHDITERPTRGTSLKVVPDLKDDLEGEPVLLLLFTDLSSSGNTVVSTVYELECQNSDCSKSFGTGGVTWGILTTETPPPTPLPTTQLPTPVPTVQVPPPTPPPIMQPVPSLTPVPTPAPQAPPMPVPTVQAPPTPVPTAHPPPAPQAKPTPVPTVRAKPTPLPTVRAKPTPYMHLPTTMQDPSTTLTWYLCNVKFEDGSTAVGSFDYDAVNKVYSNIVIATATTTYGRPLTSSEIPLDGSHVRTVPEDSSTVDLTGERYLYFTFVSALTNSGGTVMMDTGGVARSAEAKCSSSGCLSWVVSETVVSGYVTTDPTMPATTEKPIDVGSKTEKSNRKTKKKSKGKGSSRRHF